MASVHVEVISDQDGPFLPGTAIVRLNGAVVAHLRSGESIEVVTSETVSTRTGRPQFRCADSEQTVSFSCDGCPDPAACFVKNTRSAEEHGARIPGQEPRP